MFCPKCGKRLDDEAVICPNCGLKFQNAAQRRKQARGRSAGVWKLVLGALCIVNGLMSFGRRTLAMVVYVAIGGGLILWWMAVNFSPSDNEDKGCTQAKKPTSGKAAEDPKALEPSAGKYGMGNGIQPEDQGAMEKPPKFEDIFEFKTVRLVGVSYKNNDGSSRQTLLRKLRYKDPPFDKEFDVNICQYEFGDEDAIRIDAAGKTLGHIPRNLVEYFVDNWGRIDCVTAIDVVGGGRADDGTYLNYGADVTIRLKRNEDVRLFDAR